MQDPLHPTALLQQQGLRPLKPTVGRASCGLHVKYHSPETLGGFLAPQFSSGQSLSPVRLFATPWTAACLSITNSGSLLKLMSIVSVMPSHYFILCCPLLLLPSIFPSIRVFSNKLVLHISWPKYWSFSFSRTEVSASGSWMRCTSRKAVRNVPRKRQVTPSNAGVPSCMRRFLLGRKAMTNLDSLLKSRDVTWLTKVCIVKATDFSSSHVWMWELNHKEDRGLKNWCFWTVMLEKTLAVPWTARRSNQSILEEINPEYSLEGLMLKLKLQYFGLSQRADPLEKTLMLGKIEGKRKRGRQRMKWLNGITDSMDMQLSKLRRYWRTGEPGMLQSMRSERVGHDWVSEQQNSCRMQVNQYTRLDCKRPLTMQVISVSHSANLQFWWGSRRLVDLGSLW